MLEKTSHEYLRVLEEALDKADQIGYKRGIVVSFTKIFQRMEKSTMMSISYSALKEVFNELNS